MRDVYRDDFFLDPDIIMFNHASYGLTSRIVDAEGHRIRTEIESDPVLHLGAPLLEGLRARTTELARELGLDPSAMTMCSNATSGAAAIIDSVVLRPGSTVVVLASEYSSIRRAWERTCAHAGATLVTVAVPLPLLDEEQLIVALEEAVAGELAYVQMSLVSSSTATLFPVAAVAAWAHRRGGRLIVDAAHGPGHTPLAPAEWGVDAMFGTIHKWYPVLRPVGLMWLADDLIPAVRPAEVSLTYDSEDLVERFSWPGTFDPVPRLSVDTALGQWRSWQASGQLAECMKLAEAATAVLTEAGGTPTTSGLLLPPRLRAFVLPETDRAEVKAALSKAGIRAWIGHGPEGETILRIATHIYNDLGDIEAVAAVVREVLR